MITRYLSLHSCWAPGKFWPPHRLRTCGEGNRFVLETAILHGFISHWQSIRRILPFVLLTVILLKRRWIGKKTEWTF